MGHKKLEEQHTQASSLRQLSASIPVIHRENTCRYHLNGKANTTLNDSVKPRPWAQLS